MSPDDPNSPLATVRLRAPRRGLPRGNSHAQSHPVGGALQQLVEANAAVGTPRENILPACADSERTVSQLVGTARASRPTHICGHYRNPYENQQRKDNSHNYAPLNRPEKHDQHREQRRYENLMESTFDVFPDRHGLRFYRS